ncbi:cysteine desulfurase family protein [Methyloterricola oryzae]|uniref:cysteine desulfurase family protein n=1 Tax=Methyloterricola oryzae TaxID=1495050 RepID=UPI0005EB6F95|nr:cysteine desulfurase family protein [Methyloterricola oryzae]
MIYLDHNATTPMDERVLEAMLPYLGRFFGNPSSLHRLGRISRSAVEQAREQVALLVNARADDVFFTSGGTESNNTAIKGLAEVLPKGRMAIGATEHPAVSEPAERLRRRGWAVDVVAVDGQGRLDWRDHEFAEDLRFASLMLANNETGVVQTIAPIAERLRRQGVILHCDAVQAVGKIEVDFAACGAHFLTLSSHKIYGPKGVGALVADRSLALPPLLDGGGQERELRGGTENVAGIVGFGRAAELARLELEARASHLLGLRERLESGLRNMGGVRLFSAEADRLPNTLQFGLAGIEGEALVMALDRRGIAVSSGSACASGAGEPSPVLLAMGIDPGVAKTAIRVSLGKDNTAADIDALLAALKDTAGQFGVAHEAALTH